MNYNEFKNKYNGQVIDYDGKYGAQCWDLAQQYFTECLGVPENVLGGCGLVNNMLNEPKLSELLKYFDEVSLNDMKQGDIVIWTYGHIAILDNWDGEKNWYFTQNPGVAHIDLCDNSEARAFRLKQAKLEPKEENIDNTPIEEEKPIIRYTGHVQNIGWLDWISQGVCGTTGKAKRMEAIKIDAPFEVEAKAHIQDIGWKDYGKINKDTIIGTTGECKRLECLCLKGNFKYRVHIQDTGWTPYTIADGISTLGTVGQALRMEAIEMVAI